MTSFLVDANLSPRIAKFLETELGFDALSIRKMGFAELPDLEVLRLANRLGRVLITRDSDFAKEPGLADSYLAGVIYLRVDDENTRMAKIKELLAEFFRVHAESIDLEHSTVIITPRLVSITRHPSSNER